MAWLVGCRRLRVRYERRADILLGFLQLAGALICRDPVGPPKRCAAPWAPACGGACRSGGGLEYPQGVEGEQLVGA
jgi:hypothetical protein